MGGLTSSELAERVVLSILKEGHYHKFLDKLRSKLAQAQSETGQFLRDIGWELFTQPKNGFYLYAKPQGSHFDSQKLAKRAREEGLLFAPGYLFHPQHICSPWTRFNVSYSFTRKSILLPFLQSNSCKEIYSGIKRF